MVGRIKPSVFFFRSVVPRLPRVFGLTKAVAENLGQPKASAMGRVAMRFVSSHISVSNQNPQTQSQLKSEE